MQVSFREWPEANRLPAGAGAPGKDEVQVGIARVPRDPTRLAMLAARLSSDELERAARFLAEEPRLRFILGRALLRELLGDCLNLAPAALMFGYEPHGKPFLQLPAAGRELHFNLSHTDRHVAIAWSRGRRVGVDIESFHRLDDWMPVAERVFSPAELRDLYGLPEALRRAAFFKAWTCKEAYLKATGEGLSDALQAIEVSVVPGEAPRLLAAPGGPEAVRQWAIHSVPMPAGMAGAVVFEVL